MCRLHINLALTRQCPNCIIMWLQHLCGIVTKTLEITVCTHLVHPLSLEGPTGTIPSKKTPE